MRGNVPMLEVFFFSPTSSNSFYEHCYYNKIRRINRIGGVRKESWALGADDHEFQPCLFRANYLISLNRCPIEEHYVF